MEPGMVIKVMQKRLQMPLRSGRLPETRAFVDDFHEYSIIFLNIDMEFFMDLSSSTSKARI